MTNPDTLTRDNRPTIIDDGPAVEIFATEYKAASAFDTVLSFVEQQAAVFVAATGPLASQGE